MPLENFKDKEYNFNVNQEKYEWSEHSIAWNNVRRDTQGFVRKKLKEDLINFHITFELTLSDIQNYGEKNRHLFTVLKLRKLPGKILSVYIAQTKMDNEYKLVFFQRVDRKNVFVYSSVHLDIHSKYSITITKNEFIYTISIEGATGPVWVQDKSPELIGVETSYDELLLAEGHLFPIDVDDSCSGILENLHIDVVEEKPEISADIKVDLSKPKKAFISFCHVSGNDFAYHLNKGLSKNDIPTFYSDESIRMGENWEEEIVKNVKESTFAILIMTPGYDNSRIIRREISIALEYRKLLAFKHKGLDEKHLCVELTSDYTKQELDKPVVIDFTKEQIAVFDTKEDLLRKVYYELEKRDEGWFDHLSFCLKLLKDEKGEYQLYRK